MNILEKKAHEWMKNSFYCALVIFINTIISHYAGFFKSEWYTINFFAISIMIFSLFFGMSIGFILSSKYVAKDK